MWISDVNSFLFLAFFGLGLWLSYRQGYAEGFATRVQVEIDEAQGVQDDDDIGD